MRSFVLLLLLCTPVSADWSDVAEQAISASHEQQIGYQRALIANLYTGRGIAFYTLIDGGKTDIDPAPQAHALAVFLIEKGGRRKFMDCIREARLSKLSDKWHRVFRRHYGMDLNQMQVAWLSWVRQNQTSYRIICPGGT